MSFLIWKINFKRTLYLSDELITPASPARRRRAPLPLLVLLLCRLSLVLDPLVLRHRAYLAGSELPVEPLAGLRKPPLPHLPPPLPREGTRSKKFDNSLLETLEHPSSLSRSTSALSSPISSRSPISWISSRSPISSISSRSFWHIYI